MFCSISGDIFPKAAEQQRAELGLQHTTSAKDAHLQRMLPAILPCIAPPDAALHRAAANNEAELLDACKYGLMPLFSKCIFFKLYAAHSHRLPERSEYLVLRKIANS